MLLTKPKDAAAKLDSQQELSSIYLLFVVASSKQLTEVPQIPASLRPPIEGWMWRASGARVLAI
jgi:hypothetical protein